MFSFHAAPLNGSQTRTVMKSSPPARIGGVVIGSLSPTNWNIRNWLPPIQFGSEAPATATLLAPLA